MHCIHLCENEVGLTRSSCLFSSIAAGMPPLQSLKEQAIAEKYLGEESIHIELHTSNPGYLST